MSNRFKITLVRVLAIQVITLLLLGWLQHYYSAPLPPSP